MSDQDIPRGVKQYLNKPVVTFMGTAGSVRRAFKELGWEITDDNAEEFNYCWAWPLPYDQIKRLCYGQMINQMPGEVCLTRKDSLAQTLSGFEKNHPGVVNFQPKSFIIPSQLLSLEIYMQDHKDDFFIVKEATVDRGEGIVLCKGNQFRRINKQEAAVVQKYVEQPYLLRGYKFDLRLYVLVLSVDPLIVYYYKEGMARFATHRYSEPTLDNCKDKRCHLTNYSQNKQGEGGSPLKETYSWALKELPAELAAHVAREVERIIIVTMLAAEPVLAQQAVTERTNCFPRKTCGFYGFDLILQANGRVRLLEVNANPSTGCETAIDEEIKRPLFRDLISLTAPKKYIVQGRIRVPRLAADGEEGDEKYGRSTSMRLHEIKELWEEAMHHRVEGRVDLLVENLTIFEQKVVRQMQLDTKKQGGFHRLIPATRAQYMAHFSSAKYMDYLVAIMCEYGYL